MALSIGRLGGASLTSMVGVQPQNYSVKNQSAISEAYGESIQQLSGMGIGGAQPVQYTNAQLVENRIGQIREAQKVDKAYNAIASAFEGYTPAYDGSLQGASYSAAGANVDLFA